MRKTTFISRAFILGVLLLAIGCFIPPARAAGPWYVKPGGNDTSDCLTPATACETINGALGKASSGDTIKVAVGTFTGSGDDVVLITKNITISGGWDLTFTTQDGISTIDGEDTRRGVKISSGTTVDLDHLAIQNGDATTGAGFYDKFGAGIYNEGTLSLDYCQILDNTANYSAGIYVPTGSITLSNSTVDGNTAIYGVGGISITSGNTSTISYSTISSNTADNGAGISTGGTLIIDTTTISGNYAGEHGGGVSTLNGTITITNSTISGNTAIISGGGVRNEGGTVTISNTIVARNNSDWGPDCNGTISSGGYNLIGDGESCTFTPTSGDVVDVNPKIAPLADNGGPTMTHALVEGSPAIDGGDDAVCNSTDQRGISRPVGSHCDIGAFEGEISGPAENTFYVKSGGNDSNDCLSPAFACETINGALNKAFSYDVIKVASGTYTGSGSNVVLIKKDITLSGGWGSGFSNQDGISIIDGQDSRRVVRVDGPDNVTIDHFVIQNGNTTDGGGVVSHGTTITLDYCQIINNNGSNGSGIYIAKGSLDLAHSTISFNTSPSGSGGLYVSNGTTVTVENSTISGNTSSTSDSGGGIRVSGGTLVVDTSTISGNTSGRGGGINNDNGSVTLTNVTISENTGLLSAGGVRSGGTGTYSISNTIIAGNTSSVGPDCENTISSSGYNLIGDTAGCTFTPTTGDITNVDPRLNPLADNGGLTLTHALGTTSPAIDNGNDAVCGSTDQRGITRPVGAHCDIGAFEGEEPYYKNDDLVDAFAITSLPYTNSQDTSYATLETGEPDFVCAPGIASVWYKFTPGSNGFYDVDTFGSGYDTVLHVYENEGGGVYSPLSCGDDYSGPQSRSIFYGAAGTEYYIGVIQYEAPSSAPEGAVHQPIDKKQLETEGDIEGAGGNLTLSIDSYSCPADAICATVFDHSGVPLLFPDLHVYNTGGSKASYTNSVMGGYVESDSLSPGTYNVDLTGEGTFISETGWGLGYQTASAESLPAFVIRARDRFGSQTIDGEVWLRSGETNDWVGWFLEGNNLTVYATPGTYDIYVQDWWEVDYALLRENLTFGSGGGSFTLNADNLPLDTVKFYWDGVSWGYAYIPVFDTYHSILGMFPSGHTIYVSNPDTSYSLGAELRKDSGADSWFYSFFDCCDVTGSPGENESFTIGGTFTTNLAAVGDPYVPGDTGVLVTTVQDAHSNLLGAIDFRDDSGITSPSSETREDSSGTKRHPVHDIDQVRFLPGTSEIDLSSTSDGDLNQFAWFSILPDYLVEDALSNPISGSLGYLSFTAPYEFDIPDPANLGTWQGEVTVEFGPYQTDGTDTVSFDVVDVFDIIGMYSRTQKTWYLKDANNDGWGNVSTVRFGSTSTSWIPVEGDWNGDGTDTIGMYSRTQKTWYLKDANNDGWANVSTVRFGSVDSSWIPVVGDWDGDGTDTIGMYSRTQKTWYLKDANTDGWANVSTVRFGSTSTSWIPVVGDWNGNGTDTIGMYSRTQKTWYLKDANTDGWANVSTVRFGSVDTSWLPVVGDWNGNGTDTIGMYSRTQKTWYLKDANTDGWANVSTVRFGSVDTSWIPVTGKW